MPKKKLIEVALPLEAINAQSAREKSIRPSPWPRNAGGRAGSTSSSPFVWSNLAAG